MEGILFGINQTSEGSNNPKPDENDESPPPPLPLRQPRVVRPPVTIIYDISIRYNGISIILRGNHILIIESYLIYISRLLLMQRKVLSVHPRSGVKLKSLSQITTTSKCNPKFYLFSLNTVKPI